MDTYSDGLAALFEKLDLKNAIMVGHSTSGGEVARYLGGHGTKRVTKPVLTGAVPRSCYKTEKNPGGLPIRSSTASEPESRQIAQSSTTISRFPFPDRTDRVQRFLKASVNTGGCKA
jgi:pimeloyl-ACP methyl ester carboxylesterase